MALTLSQTTFTVSAHLAPNLEQPAGAVVTVWGAFNAAEDYLHCTAQLKGYELIPGGRRLDMRTWRFEAINHAAQLGAFLYVVESN